MAGRKEYELLFKLTAALGGNFNSSFSKALDTTKQLQGTLTKINSLSGKIDGFSRQSAAVDKNREKLESLKKEHEKLQREMEQTEEPTEALKKKFEKNEKQIAATTAKIEDQEKKLESLSRELKDAGVDTDRLSSSNDKLKKSYDQIKKSQEELAKYTADREKTAAAISKTKTQLTGTVGTVVALGAAIYAGPVKSAMDFESKMADVVKVVDGLRDSKTGELTEEYRKMKKEILDLSTKIPVTAEGLTEIAAAAGQAGIARNEIVKFTSDAGKMGIAFDVSADQAGDWMAKWRTSFGMTQDEVVSLADKINYLSNNSASTAAEISNIVSKIGPLGEVAGLSSGAISALGATLVAVGVNDDVAATGIKKVMTTMTAGTAVTKRQQAVLDKMGLSATDLAKRMQTDAQGAILDFMAAVKKLPAAEQTAALKNYFGEESVAAIAPMLSRLDLLKTSFERVGDSAQYAGSMEAEFTARADTNANKVEMAKASLTRLSILLGDTFLPYVGQAAEKVSELVTKFADFAAENPELVKTIAKVVGGLLAFKIGALGLKLAFLDVKQGVNAVQMVMALFKGKTAAAGVETVGLISKLKNAGAGISSYFGGIKTAAGGVGGAFGKVFSGGKIAGLFSKLGGLASGTIGKVFSGIGGKVTGIFTGTAGKLVGVFGKAGTKIAAGPLGKIGSFIGKGLGNVGTLLAPLGKLGGAILGPFSGILGKILPIVGVVTLIISAIQILRDNIDKVRAVVERVFGKAGLEVFDKVVAAVTNIGETIKNIFTDGNLGGARDFLINLFGENATGVIDGVISVLQTVWNVVSGFISFVNTSVKPIIADIFNFIVGTVLPMIAQKFAEWAPTISAIIQGLWTVISAIATQVMNVINFIMPTIKAVITTALDSIMGVIGGVLNVIKGVLDFVIGVFTGNWKQAWEGVKTIFSGVWQAIKSIVKAPINFIIAGINTLIRGLNKLKIPDWVPAIGGKGFNISEIPQFAKGTNKTPDTFIAGERGAELITNARNRAVFTAAQTGNILKNIRGVVSAVQSAGGVSGGFPQLAYAGAGGVSAPSVTAPAPYSSSLVIHSEPKFYVGENTDTGEIEEALKRHDEELLAEIEARQRNKKADEERTRYE
ncbi:MAG: phage tail tape measure protein [Oscillibacter ruminantium]|uniref:phage tail tape measure protein n=1 Tax=Oscillibacter ruminantium TaxID=1263547 RepID=UPI002B1FE36D|nr:phage tail tape measure protein [Oscillibacter ruminantium]MEA5041379.1 phage tail tape measure protein [Oscillibacter ruminantium]